MCARFSKPKRSTLGLREKKTAQNKGNEGPLWYFEGKIVHRGVGGIPHFARAFPNSKGQLWGLERKKQRRTRQMNVPFVILKGRLFIVHKGGGYSRFCTRFSKLKRSTRGLKEKKTKTVPANRGKVSFVFLGENKDANPSVSLFLRYVLTVQNQCKISAKSVQNKVTSGILGGKHSAKQSQLW